MGPPSLLSAVCPHAISSLPLSEPFLPHLSNGINHAGASSPFGKSEEAEELIS